MIILCVRWLHIRRQMLMKVSHWEFTSRDSNVYSCWGNYVVSLLVFLCCLPYLLDTRLCPNMLLYWSGAVLALAFIVLEFVVFVVFRWLNQSVVLSVALPCGANTTLQHCMSFLSSHSHITDYIWGCPCCSLQGALIS